MNARGFRGRKDQSVVEACSRRRLRAPHHNAKRAALQFTSEMPHQMPQVPPAKVKEFLDYLGKKGVSV